MENKDLILENYCLFYSKNTGGEWILPSSEWQRGGCGNEEKEFYSTTNC